MPATLIESTDPIEIKTLSVLLYGQPGARKSSILQTAAQPFTFAFDKGIYRAHGRKDCAFFDAWGDVVRLCGDASLHRSGSHFQTEDQPEPDRYRLLVSKVASAKTLGIDTLGVCLDKMAEGIIFSNPKMGSRSGGLTIQGYGQLKTTFSNWCGLMRLGGQDLVFICHEDSERRADETYYKPSIVGGSYNTIMNVADLVGYMHFENGKRVLDFTPSDRWMAKSPPCGWPSLILPEFTTQPNWLAERIAEAKASMGKISQQSATVATVVDEWRVWMHGDAATLDEVNLRFRTTLPKVPEASKAAIWKIILDRMIETGHKYIPEKKFFVLDDTPAPTGGQ